MNPKILYKYLSPERVDVVQTKLIRFTQAGAFNDVFEFLPTTMSKSASRRRSDQDFDANWKRQAKRDPTLKRGDPVYRLMKKDYFRYSAEIAALVDRVRADTAVAKLSKDYGALCLTSRRDCIPMWSHYAKDHQGFVVGFDSSHPFLAERLTQIYRKVKYSKLRPNLPKTSRIVNMFFVKSTLWSYEKEWRFVKPLKHAAQIKSGDRIELPVHLFEFPVEAITQIVYGARADALLKHQVSAALQPRANKGRPIMYFESLIDSSEYRLRIIQCAPAGSMPP